MPQTQKAVLVHQLDREKPSEGLKVTTELSIPEPEEGEVLVRVVLRPINPTDILAIKGYSSSLRKLPRVPGSEGVGLVQSDGKTFKKGARVVGVPFPRQKENGGSWQQYVTIPEADLAAVPQVLSNEVAAQIFINPCTVRGFFDVLDIPKGGYLLQSAAGSVLGRQVIQFAKHYGIRTINVIRREEQKQELLNLGADEVIASTGSSEEDIAERVNQITDSKGAYAAVDAVGGELTGKLLEGVRPKGTLLVYGALSGRTFSAGIPDVLFSLKIVTGFMLMAWKQSIGPEAWQQRLQEVIQLLVEGTVQPFSGQTFALEEVKEAITEAQKPARGGKVFLKG